MVFSLSLSLGTACTHKVVSYSPMIVWLSQPQKSALCSLLKSGECVCVCVCVCVCAEDKTMPHPPLIPHSITVTLKHTCRTNLFGANTFASIATGVR